MFFSNIYFKIHLKNCSKIFIKNNINLQDLHYLFNLLYSINIKTVDLALDTLIQHIQIRDVDNIDDNDPFLEKKLWQGDIIHIINLYKKHISNEILLPKIAYLLTFIVSFTHHELQCLHINKLVNLIKINNNNRFIIFDIINILSTLCVEHRILIQYLYSNNRTPSLSNTKKQNNFSILYAISKMAFVKMDVKMIHFTLNMWNNFCLDHNFKYVFITTELFENYLMITHKLINNKNLYYDIFDYNKSIIGLIYNLRSASGFKYKLLSCNGVQILNEFNKDNFINKNNIFMQMYDDIYTKLNHNYKIKTYDLHMIVKNLNHTYLKELLNKNEYDYFFSKKDDNDCYPLDYIFTEISECKRFKKVKLLTQNNCVDSSLIIEKQYIKIINNAKKIQKKNRMNILQNITKNNNILIKDVVQEIIEFLPINTIKQFKIE
jgi:hypothetical protein